MSPEGVGKVYSHALVVLRNVALPLHSEEGNEGKGLLTENGREFCNAEEAGRPPAYRNRYEEERLKTDEGEVKVKGCPGQGLRFRRSSALPLEAEGVSGQQFGGLGAAGPRDVHLEGFRGGTWRRAFGTRLSGS